MIRTVRRTAQWVVPIAALAIMVVGLWPRAAPLTDEQRVEQIAARLKCPFCEGETIADATSQVARDLEVVIAEQVAAGRSSDEIVAFFVDRYGEQVVLDPPLVGWGLALWLLPALVGAIGAVGILRLRRARNRSPARSTKLDEPEQVVR